ncbi:MAG: DHH family phosphoesterase [Butyribacter sp.]|nr:DHH family phosphoesterase [bacterium]MDY3853448.1 DHH family phosphoesterase [Butyribacter sp.]
MEKDMRVVVEIKEDGQSEGDTAELIEKTEEFLPRFLNHKKICIQCHDNPDADALASGFALYHYYSHHGIETQFVYGGRNQITKPNLVMMIQELEIPVQYITEAPECDLLITADCQYGSGNVTKFEVPEVAMVDHHQCGLMQNENDCIKSNLGSCSTVVWSLFQKIGYDISEDINLSTALYYGLYNDTNQFAEIFHPLDKDMRDSLNKNDTLLFRLMNTNLSLRELNIASTALTKEIFCQEHRFSVIPAEQCDPNILGIISDFVIQVEEIDMCVAYNPNPGGFKLSIRSCVKEVKANELAEFICEGVGNGGGHLTKAGGFVAGNSYHEKYQDKDFSEFLSERIEAYLSSYEVIYAKDYTLDRTELKPYYKKAIPVGVAIATDFLPEGIPVLVRTLEGDVDIVVEKDIYFMIGIEGEVYPIKKDKFERTYRYVDDTPEFMMEYAPTVRNNIDGEVYKLLDHMRSCVATGTSKIYAKPLEKNVKIFTAWDENKYYRGKIGDFIVMREDDIHDIYVVRRNIFFKTYEETSE